MRPDALPHGIGELQRVGDHVVGAEDHASALGIELSLRQSGVEHGPLGRSDAHLRLAADGLKPLADGLLLVTFEGPEVVDRAGKAAGLAPKGHGKEIGGKEAQPVHAAAAGGQGFPEFGRRIAQGGDHPQAGNHHASLIPAAGTHAKILIAAA